MLADNSEECDGHSMLPTLNLPNPVALLDGVTTGGAVTNGWTTISDLAGGTMSSGSVPPTHCLPITRGASGITISALSGIPAKVQIIAGANPPAGDSNGNPLMVSLPDIAGAWPGGDPRHKHYEIRRPTIIWAATTSSTSTPGGVAQKPFRRPVEKKTLSPVLK